MRNNTKRAAKIGYYSFGKNELNYGLHMVLHAVKGYEPERVTVHNAATFDLILFSLYWWEHYYDYVKLIIDAGINPNKKKPILIVGGFGIYNPLPINKFFHYACLGDGENLINELIEQALDGRVTHPSIYAPSDNGRRIEWNAVPDIHNSTYLESGKILRVEIARGCKWKCHFCALTYLKKYRESDFEQVTELLKESPVKSVSLFAPERTGYSNYKELYTLTKSLGLHDLASDVRLDQFEELNESEHFRFGLEGFSYRLRCMIGKRYKHEYVVDQLREAHTRKMESKKQSGFHVYLIMDLPSEGAEDYQEFYKLLEDIEKFPEAEELTFIVTPNVFFPNPFTPMQWFGVDLDRDYRKIWHDLVRPGGRKDWKFKMAERVRMFGNYKRFLSLVTIRGDERHNDLIYNVVTNVDWKSEELAGDKRKLQLIRKYMDQNGLDHTQMTRDYCPSEPLPYDFIDTQFKKEKLALMYRNILKFGGVQNEYCSE